MDVEENSIVGKSGECQVSMSRLKLSSGRMIGLPEKLIAPLGEFKCYDSLPANPNETTQFPDGIF